MTKKLKKKRNKKYRANRVDMRTGGRVSKAHGGSHNEDLMSPTDMPVSIPVGKRPDIPLEERDIGIKKDTRLLETPDIHPIIGEPLDIGWTPKKGGGGIPTKVTPPESPKGTADPNRNQRVVDTGTRAEEIARGEMEIPLIPAPKTIGREGTAIKKNVGQMDDTLKPVGTQDIAVGTEQVATGDVDTAPTPQERQAAQITQDELSVVPEQAQVDKEQGDISRIAEAAGVDKISEIDSAQVAIEPGAVANRVVGTISPAALAPIVQNAGTSLARITRAKKQLSKAGLSDEDINTIGNDPELLEDRLADFSEEERGIIAGLPEEALVSTQINGLLEGMENGEIPPWASPAVSAVEQMLAQRGLSASSVGRDNLFNAIIQSAMPIAQSNAQAIQQSVSQQKTIEAQAAESNAQRRQQTALSNASNVFQLNMAQFSADQQTELSNSKFLQTVSLTESNAEQQSIIQRAALLSQANLTEANLQQQAEIENAKNFLQMDLANLDSAQQASMLKAQQTQQRMLSNQAAQNAAAQFNATSENQTNQFMLNLQANMSQFNSSQKNAMEQFNSQQLNAAEARRVGNELQASILDSQMALDAQKFNNQQEFAREQFNAQQEMVIAQSNVEWRRKANTADTAAFNAVNQQNAMNAFNLTASANNFLWQELRDEADFDFKRWDNDQQRKTSMIIAALGNEQGVNKKDYWDDNVTALYNVFSGFLGS